jgi:hypothetical protein
MLFALALVFRFRQVDFNNVAKWQEGVEKRLLRYCLVEAADEHGGL